MATFIDIPQPNGGDVVHVALEGIFRVGPLAPGDQGPSAVSLIEWSGGQQITALTVDDLATMVTAAGVRLIEFHAAGNVAVFLNPLKVSAIGPANSDLYPGTPTLITVGGKPQPVRESQQEVYRVLTA